MNFAWRSTRPPSTVEEGATFTITKAQGRQMDRLFTVDQRSDNPPTGGPKVSERIPPVEMDGRLRKGEQHGGHIVRSISRLTRRSISFACQTSMSVLNL